MEKNLGKKKTESLCCIPEMNTILYINYISIKKEKKKQVTRPRHIQGEVMVHKTQKRGL